MTAFSGRRFSVYANQSKEIECECQRVGHTEADRRGRCYRCGQKTFFTAAEIFANPIREISGSSTTMSPAAPMACTEKEHRFLTNASSCSCGTVRRHTPREEAHAR